MVVEPDQGEQVALDPRALDALAEAGRAAARGARIGEVAGAVVEATARATGAALVVARVTDDDHRHLVTRGVAAASRALAAELEGRRVSADGWTLDETALANAPDVVRALAARIGAESALVVPIEARGAVAGSIELYGADDSVDGVGTTTARIAATQLALAVHARLGSPERNGAASDAFRLAADAVAAGGDVAKVETTILRLAIELAHADGAALWRIDESGERERVAAIGDVPNLPPSLSPGAAAHERGAIVIVPLHEHDVLGVVVRTPSPDPAAVERLQQFGQRAAQALRTTATTRALAAELEQTRALLTVVGQASAQLSLAHALATAIDRVAELVQVDRLAIYLLDDGRLVAAADRGLAGPHVRVGERLLELALGPFRGRGAVVVPDVSAERRLATVSDALAEAGIDAATAIPLTAADAVTGLLAVYPPRGRAPSENEAALLTALADRLAVTVENAKLHEEATRLGRELEHALTSERAAARQLRALYEISRSFAQSLSLDVTLQSLARTAVELLDVDAAVLRMPDQRRDQLLPLAIYVGEERLVKPLRAMLFRAQPLVGPIRQLFRSGEPLLLDADSAGSAAAAQMLLAPFLARGSTVAVIPVATPSEVLASLTIVSLAPGRPIGRETVEAALAIGGQAALAIDNARLYQQQKDFADSMQRSLLPQVRPAVEGIDIGEVYASSAHVDVGGDLYDYLALEDGRLAVVLGDVTGHGIDAAADMAMAKFVFRSLAREHPEPGAFLAAANDVVVGEIAAGKFITMLYLLIDPATGELSCGSAGHPSPRVIGDDGSVRSISARGLALGVDSGMTYDAVRDRLDPHGAVVLYTDGVIEARRGGELYGTERLDALLARRHALRAEDVAASVVQAARRFAGGELLDDCAVVVLKRR